MRKTMLALAVLAALAGPLPAASRVYEVDRGGSQVAFVIGGMIGKVRGRFTRFTGRIEGDAARPETASVEFTLQAASINTGLPRRDDHLRGPDFFDVKKYPDIVFRSRRIVSRERDRHDVHGTLSMHGVDKAVVLPVTIARTDLGADGVEKVRFELRTTLVRQDFGIVWNKTLESGGLLLGDQVAVEIDLEAMAQK